MARTCSERTFCKPSDPIRAPESFRPGVPVGLRKASSLFLFYFLRRSSPPNWSRCARCFVPTAADQSKGGSREGLPAGHRPQGPAAVVARALQIASVAIFPASDLQARRPCVLRRRSPPPRSCRGLPPPPRSHRGLPPSPPLAALGYELGKISEMKPRGNGQNRFAGMKGIIPMLQFENKRIAARESKESQ